MNKLATKSVKPEVVRKLKDDGHFFFSKLDTTSLPKQKNGKEINAGISTKLYLMQLLEIEIK